MQPGCKHWQEVRRAHTVHKLGMNRQSKMEYIVQLSSAEMINYCFKTAVQISKHKEQFHSQDPGCTHARNACFLLFHPLKKSSGCGVVSWEGANHLGPRCCGWVCQGSRKPSSYSSLPNSTSLCQSAELGNLFCC